MLRVFSLSLLSVQHWRGRRWPAGAGTITIAIAVIMAIMCPSIISMDTVSTIATGMVVAINTKIVTSIRPWAWWLELGSLARF